MLGAEQKALSLWGSIYKRGGGCEPWMQEISSTRIPSQACQASDISLSECPGLLLLAFIVRNGSRCSRMKLGHLMKSLKDVPLTRQKRKKNQLMLLSALRLNLETTVVSYFASISESWEALSFNLLNSEYVMYSTKWPCCFLEWCCLLIGYLVAVPNVNPSLTAASVQLHKHCRKICSCINLLSTISF